MKDLELMDVVEPFLPVARYRFVFRAEKPLPRDGYLGSAWRGVFGRALRQLVCIARDKECSECMLYRSCVYPYVFETPVDESEAVLGRTQYAPHPFVLDAELRPVVIDPRVERIGMTLFGRANQYLAYLVQAMKNAGAQGLRSQGQPLELVDLEQEHGERRDWKRIYQPPGKIQPMPAAALVWPPAPPRVRISLLTPLRLRRREDLVTPEAFHFADLFSNLLRRVSLLMSYHAGRRLEVDFAGLVAASREVRWSDGELGWKEWTRYSGRQKTKMQMGGMVGWVEYEAARWPQFWPYLWVGQWTHAGKGTSMGLGRYELEVLP